MMSEPLAEFADASSEAEEAVGAAFANVVIAFAKYAARDLKMDEADWRRVYAEEPPAGTYWDGYNAALDMLDSAAEIFTGVDARP